MTRSSWYGHTDLEICIMSARSAQRTRRRRWRMGRDRAGEREMRTHGRRVAARHLSSREGSVTFCFSHPSHFVVPSNAEVLPTLLFFHLRSVSTARIGCGFGSGASFHFRCRPRRFGESGRQQQQQQQQQDRPLPGLMKQISLFARRT